MTDSTSQSMTEPTTSDPAYQPLTPAPAELSAAAIKEHLAAYHEVSAIRRKIEDRQRYLAARTKLDADIEQNLKEIRDLLASGLPYKGKFKKPIFPLGILCGYMPEEMRKEVAVKWEAMGWSIDFKNPRKPVIDMSVMTTSKVEKPLAELTLTDMPDMRKDPAFVRKILEITTALTTGKPLEGCILIEQLEPRERHYFELTKEKATANAKANANSVA